MARFGSAVKWTLEWSKKDVSGKELMVQHPSRQNIVSISHDGMMNRMLKQVQIAISPMFFIGAIDLELYHLISNWIELTHVTYH